MHRLERQMLESPALLLLEHGLHDEIVNVEDELQSHSVHDQFYHALSHAQQDITVREQHKRHHELDKQQAHGENLLLAGDGVHVAGGTGRVGSVLEADRLDLAEEAEVLQIGPDHAEFVKATPRPEDGDEGEDHLEVDVHLVLQRLQAARRRGRPRSEARPPPILVKRRAQAVPEGLVLGPERAAHPRDDLIRRRELRGAAAPAHGVEQVVLVGHERSHAMVEQRQRDDHLAAQNEH
mmetsp:Transcript_99925/g.305429  ORF Transcript_99925/g.305429 Transcript_99925/m.305429 type:complete len:237 (+) Transcript_99925:776-1486(+)